MARRSNLAGTHPAAPEPAERKERVAQEEPQARPTGRYAKATLTVRPDVLDEAKDGFWYLMAKGEYRSFAEYVTDALAAFNEQVRTDHLKGKKFPARPHAKLPTVQPR